MAKIIGGVVTFLVVVFFAVIMLGDEERHIITVNRLEAMSKINVLYVAIADLYTLETEKGSSLSRLVRGGAYYSIDLSKIKTNKQKAQEGDEIIITLPCPTIESFPNPSKSVEFRPKTGFLVNDTGLNRIREMYDGKDREKIKKIAEQPEYMRMAKVQTEKVLRDILPELKVAIKWVD